MILPNAFYQDSIIESKRISLDVNNLSLHRGYGIFDYFTYHNGNNKYLHWYITRFYNSAKKAHLSIDITQQELIDIVNQLYIRNQIVDTNFKLILTAGTSTNGYEPIGENELLILSYQHQPQPVTHYTTGVKLITYEHRRPFADIKSTNYIIPYLLKKELISAQAIDVLYVMNQKVSETSRANIFVVKSGALFTTDAHILPGITRRVILEQYMGHTINIKDLNINDLLTADEVFITSSTKGAMPVVAIDGHTIADGHVGAISRGINQWFLQHTSC